MGESSQMPSSPISRHGSFNHQIMQKQPLSISGTQKHVGLQLIAESGGWGKSSKNFETKLDKLRSMSREPVNKFLQNGEGYFRQALAGPKVDKETKKIKERSVIGTILTYD